MSTATRYVEVNGASLYLEDHDHRSNRGEAMPSLVLLHGGLSSSASLGPLVDSLANRFRVITPDSRGHGRSINPAGTLGYAELADDVAALVTALGLDRPVVGGWSDGGQAVLELAVRHPGTARALICGGAYPDVTGTGLGVAHRRLLGADAAGVPADAAGVPDLDHLDAELGEHADETRALHHGGDDHWATLITQTAPMWLGYPGLPATALARVSAPVLVLAGDRDEFVELDLSIGLYRALSHAELAVCPHADHSAPLTPDRAAAFAAAIADFTIRHCAS